MGIAGFLIFVGICGASLADSCTTRCTACRDDGNCTYINPGWNLVLKASKGNKESVYDLWNSDRFTPNPTPLERALNSLCGCHFKSRLVEKWDSLNIKRVAIALYEQPDVDPKKLMYFDGRGSNKLNWLTQERLISAPWCDLKNSTTNNFFSVKGDAGLRRRFYINKSYGGCHNDHGWFAVADGGTLCPWEKVGHWPAFIYCKGHVECQFNAESLALADVFAVYIEV